MTLEEFAVFLRAAAEQVEPELRVALAATTVAAAESAKGYIGEYQAAAGPVPAWPPLAESTVTQKIRLGYAPPDNPLLRTGEMRDSITTEIEGLVGAVGSDSKIALYQEMGTSKMPPRPFLARAVWEHIPTLQNEMEEVVVRIFSV